MSDILSQNEIDALLNALNAGEDVPVEDEGEVQAHAAVSYTHLRCWLKGTI